VPGQVAGEHADQHVRPDAFFQPGRLADLVASSCGPRPGEPRSDVPAAISGLTAELRHYQRRAVAWLAGITGLGFGAVLADDMGLGKTLTIIAFHLHRSASPTLVVCPASLLTNYLRERPYGWDAGAEAARSGKLAALDDLLAAIAERAEASLIFTGYVSMAHLLAAHLGARGIRADIVYGGVPAARRQEIVDRFQSGASECLILSVRAGSSLMASRGDPEHRFRASQAR